MPTQKNHSGCGDKQCWCAGSKTLVIADDVKNVDSAKQFEPFHRGWWLNNHPELSAVDYEKEAQEAKLMAERKIRDSFQTKHPKYMPPPWDEGTMWGTWYATNLQLYGGPEFEARFPKFTGIDSHTAWWEPLLKTAE